MRNFWLRNNDIVSVHDNPVRTNNIAESCHRHLVRRLGGVHPPFHQFIQRLVIYIMDATNEWNDLGEGRLPVHRNRQQTQQQRRDFHIRDLQRRLELNRINLMDFLITTMNTSNFRNDLTVIINNIDNNSDDEAETLLPRDEDIRSNIHVAVNQERSVIIITDSNANEDDNQLPPSPPPSSPISIYSSPPSSPSPQPTPSCRVCFTNPVDTLILPCRHLCICSACIIILLRTHQQRRFFSRDAAEMRHAQFVVDTLDPL